MSCIRQLLIPSLKMYPPPPPTHRQASTTSAAHQQHRPVPPSPIRHHSPVPSPAQSSLSYPLPLYLHLISLTPCRHFLDPLSPSSTFFFTSSINPSQIASRSLTGLSACLSMGWKYDLTNRRTLQDGEMGKNLPFRWYSAEWEKCGKMSPGIRV